MAHMHMQRRGTAAGERSEEVHRTSESECTSANV